MKILRALGAALLVHLLSGVATAEVGPNPYEDEPDPEAEKKAVAHFDRGVAFFEEGKFDEALAEFLASHELNPNWAILYNIGVCYHRLGRYEDALDMLQDYLDEGGAWIYPERKKLVADLIEKMQDSCGYLAFPEMGQDVHITIDGKRTVVTPLDEPLLVSPGLHQVTFQLEGHYDLSREVEVAVGQTVSVQAQLEPTPSHAKWLAVKERGGLARGLGVTTILFASLAGVALTGAGITSLLALHLDGEDGPARELMWSTSGLLVGAGATALAALTLWLVLRLRVMKGIRGAMPWVSVGPLGPSGAVGITVAVMPRLPATG